jgi:predicted nucleic-acid-binding protein
LKYEGAMIAADTNVVIRLLTADDAAQHAKARLLFEREQVWIARTVILEAFWVLRSLYAFDERTILTALNKLLGLRNVHVEEARAVASAVALAEGGIDFADALHLTGRPDGAVFVSFDRAFVKRASRAGVEDVRNLSLSH